MTQKILITLCCLLATYTNYAQSLGDTYLHYKTNHYWDTILYKSKYEYYIDNNSNSIAFINYPVLAYEYTEIISDSPLVTKDIYHHRTTHSAAFNYVREGDAIFLCCYDNKGRKEQLLKEFSLIENDTVKKLYVKNSLNSETGFSVDGKSVFKGQKNVIVNNKVIPTYHFLIFKDPRLSEKYYFTEEVYLEKSTLIPIKNVIKKHETKSNKYLLYSTEIILDASSNVLPDYSTKTTHDLDIYTNTELTWTNEQKEWLKNRFGANYQDYVNCLLPYLDGVISFYDIENNSQFLHLMSSKTCK